MTYEYKDDFVTNSIDPDVLADEELKAIAEVDLLGVTDEPFRENLVTSTVYMELCTQQIEAEGMSDKYDAYERKYKRTLNLAKTSQPSDVSNIPIGRG